MKLKPREFGCCFLPDAKVKLLSGYAKISSLAAGDVVMGYDFANSLKCSGIVARVDIDLEPQIVSIKLGESDELICTPSQRLWVRNEWVLAGAITVGMQVSGSPCKSIQVRDWNRDVYTLVVNPWNNYIVLTQNGAEIVAHDNSSDLGYPPGFDERISNLST